MDRLLLGLLQCRLGIGWLSLLINLIRSNFCKCNLRKWMRQTLQQLSKRRALDLIRLEQAKAIVNDVIERLLLLYQFKPTLEPLVHLILG